MVKLFSCCIFLVVLITTLQSANPQGWIIVQNISETGHDVKVQTLYVQNNIIRVVDASHIFMVDLNSELITLMLPDEKIYWSGTPTELTEGLNRMVSAQIEQALHQVPPEQRALYRAYFEELMQLPGNDPIKEHRYMMYNIIVNRIPGIKIIAGHETEQYEVLVDGRLVEEVSVAPALKPKGKMDFGKFFGIFSQFSGQITTRGYEFSQVYLDLLNYGYPLRTVRFDKLGRQTVEVSRIEETILTDLDFMVPLHYEPTAIDTLLQRELQKAQMQDEIQMPTFNNLNGQN